MSLWDRICAHGAGAPWEPEHVLDEFQISPSGAIVPAGRLAQLEALQQRTLEQKEDARLEQRRLERVDDAARIEEDRRSREEQFHRERGRALGLSE